MRDARILQLEEYDSALLDLPEMQQVSADERLGDTCDIGDWRRIARRRYRREQRRNDSSTNSGSKIPTPRTGRATK
jgi:hypothetical protein